MLTGLPADPVILLSVVNTKLRDYYDTLNALCEDMDVAKEELTNLSDFYSRRQPARQTCICPAGGCREGLILWGLRRC